LSKTCNNDIHTVQSIQSDGYKTLCPLREELELVENIILGCTEALGRKTNIRKIVFDLLSRYF
jgi:hypothetical protein